MISKNITEARANLFQLVNQVCESHEPVHIRGKQGVAVLISEEDWISIEETLHLVSIPGVKESILEGRKTPIDQCDDRPGW